MVRAGISPPALQRLMGHLQIHTTMLYVQLAPQDVWREYARAIENWLALVPSNDPMNPLKVSLDQIFESLHPEPRRDSPTRHAQGLPGCGAPFSPLSPSRFPRNSAVWRNSAAILSAGLVWLLVRTGSAIVQPDPQTAPDPHLPSAGGSGRPRPPHPVWLRFAARPPAAGSMAAKTASLKDDQRLQQELRRTSTICFRTSCCSPASPVSALANASAWPLDRLRQVGGTFGRFHVPSASCTPNAQPSGRCRGLRHHSTHSGLAPWPGRNFWPDRKASCYLMVASWGAYHRLFETLADAATRAGCSAPVTPHRLRHTYASEMLRLGVILPALMQLLGHNDIAMTMRYLHVTQGGGSAARVPSRTPERAPLPAPAFSPEHARTAAIFPPSSRHWRPPATFWRCTVAA